MKLQRNTIIVLAVALVAVVAIYFTQKTVSQKDEQAKEISVYFIKTVSPKKSVVIPVNRKVLADNSSFSFAINELLQGPTLQEKKQGLFTEIPEKTVLLSIKETKKDCVINLSKDFESGGGSESMSKRVEQLEKTAIDNSAGKSVYLEIAGKRVQSVGGEGVEVTQPLEL